MERNGVEQELPVAEVKAGDTVIVRPGEKIAVDGEVITGQATVDQSTITGESMPVEVAAGSHVFAATIARLGGIRIRATRIGADTTFGRVVKMVEEAEAHRADVQRIADKFSGYYLPVVTGIATLTFNYYPGGYYQYRGCVYSGVYYHCGNYGLLTGLNRKSQ